MYPKKNHTSSSCHQLKTKHHVTRVSTKNAISSNLLTIDLNQAFLCGVDILKGPTINLENYSTAELVNKLNDTLACHEHLKTMGLIPHDKQPIIHFDICYESAQDHSRPF